MKRIVPAFALAASSVAFAQSAPAPAPLDQPSYETPARPWTDVEEAARKDCADRIQQARAAAGKPELERKPAKGTEPLHQYAVDTRVDGCGVLVPVSDSTDLRELPAPSQELRKIPANPAN